MGNGQSAMVEVPGPTTDATAARARGGKRRRPPRATPTLGAKPHAMSEATTISESDSEEASDKENDDDDEDAAPRGVPRPTLWDQLVGLLSLSLPRLVPCYDEGTTPPSPRPSPRPSTALPRPKKRKRGEPTAMATTLAAMEAKHRAFWELVQRMLALNDVVLMIRVLQDYLLDRVGASACAVFLVDPNAHTMSRVMRGQPTASGLAPHRGLVGHVLATKTPISWSLVKALGVYDPVVDLPLPPPSEVHEEEQETEADDEEDNNTRGRPEEASTQRLLCVPLVDNNNVYAVVQVTMPPSTEGQQCVAEEDLDMKLLTWLGPILSSCMRKCIEYHDVLLSERTQKALLHIISSSDTEDTVLNLVDGVIAGACHITKAERLSLFMVDWETDELWTLSSSFHENTLRLPIQGSAIGHAAMHSTTLNITDAANDKRFAKDFDIRRGIMTRCALYVPVGVENPTNGDQQSRPIAVLEILNKADGEVFTLDDECAFEAFASEVAVILRRRSNEIQYIKLLADTRAEKVLAQRAKSQVNLLECYTEYVANTSTNHAADRLRHSFFKSPSRECVVCATEHHGDHVGHSLVGNGHHDHQKSQPRRPQMLPPTVSSRNAACRRIPLWDLNIFALDVEALPSLIRDIFFDFNIHKILNTDKRTISNFILTVKESYHPNPFHNYLHAVSVVHAAYTILKTTDAAQLLQPMDIAACLIAAYCHDVDHPGHTNSYEIVSRSQLAIVYSDESVLERHHACTTFRILLKDKDANILQNLSTADYRYVRKMIVSAILATDMAQHFKMCEAMEKMMHSSPHQKSTSSISNRRDSISSEPAQSGSASSKSDVSGCEIFNVVREAVFQGEGSSATPRTGSAKSLSARVLACTAIENPDNSYRANFGGTLEERTFLVKAIVHSSDLCGQVFPKPVALKWSNMISKEFAYQALLEQAENLPVSYQHMDDPLQMVEGQHFFAHKIVFPLWSLMHRMFPELNECVENLKSNVTHYEQEMLRLKLHRQSVGSEGSICSDGSVGTQSEDEGMAVPGVARCTPAKFNSFRTMKTASSQGSAVNADEDGDVVALSRQTSSFSRSRNASIASSADEADNEFDADEDERIDEDEDEEVVVVADINSPALLPGLS